MATIDVLDKQGKKAGNLTLEDNIFDITVNDQVVYDVVRYYMSRKRSGTASTKRRAEVSGTGAKHHRQKGTGMARAGSARVPHWRGGGVVFGPKPRDFSIKLNKKVRKLALKGVLSERLRESRLKVIDKFELENAKTKEFQETIIKYFEADDFRSALLVLPEYNKNIFQAARNIDNIRVVTTQYINPYQVLLYDNLVFTKDAITKLQEALS